MTSNACVKGQVRPSLFLIYLTNMRALHVSFILTSGVPLPYMCSLSCRLPNCPFSPRASLPVLILMKLLTIKGNAK